MKHQDLFPLKDKSKKIKCRLLQFLFGALRVKAVTHKNNYNSNDQLGTLKISQFKWKLKEVISTYFFFGGKRKWDIVEIKQKDMTSFIISSKSLNS